MKILTRDDYSFDSIAWALETHVKKPDDRTFNFAALYGNEDAPNSIDFWRSSSPTAKQKPDYRWYGVAHKITVEIQTVNPRNVDDILRLVLGLKGLIIEGVSMDFKIERSEILDRLDEEENGPF